MNGFAKRLGPGHSYEASGGSFPQLAPILNRVVLGSGTSLRLSLHWGTQFSARIMKSHEVADHSRRLKVYAQLVLQYTRTSLVSHYSR
jgi:hypothetical protein